MLNAMKWSRGALCALLVCAVGGLTACDDEGGGIRQAETPSLQINPRPLVFPKVQPGSAEEREVEVRNIGQGELLIQEIRLEVGGSNEFEMFWRDTPGRSA